LTEASSNLDFPHLQEIFGFLTGFACLYQGNPYEQIE